MRISVIVPDRTIVVDGLAVTFSGAPADDSVHTLQYDTDAAEGIVTYVDQRSEGLRDPAAVEPWLSLWGASFAAAQEKASVARAAADQRFRDWQAEEKTRAAEFERQQEEARKASEAAAKKAMAEEDARVEAKVREVIKQMAQAKQDA